MVSHHIESFFRKSWSEKASTAKFFLRRGLAALPYLPVPVRLKISADEEIAFRWSYLVPFYDPDRGLFDYWGHDVPELRLLWKILKPGMVFFDVGAFHGIYSVVAAKRLGMDGQVVAFEPSLEARRRLELHLRWNGIRNARVEGRAISSKSSESTFFQVISGDTTRNGLRPPSSTDVVTPLSIQTVSLDQYVSEAGLRRIDVVKLDVEGGELDVLQGATKVLNEFRPIFICEVLDLTSQAWGYDAKETISTLKTYEFEWFEFCLDGSLAPHEIRDHYPQIKNYLAVPREKCEWCMEQVLR